MAAGKEFQTLIRIAGEIDPSTQSAVKNAVKKLQQLEEATLEAAGASTKLAKKISDQNEELAEAKKKYADYVVSGEKGTKQAKELAKKIKALSSDMKDNEKTLKKATDAADKLTGGLDDVGDSAKKSGEGFTVMKGAISDLVSKGIQKLISGCVNAAKSIAGLADSTREYREDMGKLETAWESAGKSTETATALYKDFYSVLGEEDRSVEAVNHLAKFVDTEKDLQKWTNIATGVWGTFGDSLPIEGLTEAANETAKVGKVTGVLADALTWAGIDEERFNKMLEKANSEQERAKLITNALNATYKEAAENYRENNASIIEARKANSDYTDVLATLGEKIEPITTKVREGFTRILEKALELVNGVDFAALGEKIDNAFANFIDNVLPKVQSAIEWIGNHKDVITAIGVAIGVVSAALGVLNVVLAAQSAIMMANPVTWIVLGIVAAVTALVAIIAVCIKHWDDIKAAASSALNWIKDTWSGIATWIDTKVVQPVANFFSNLWDKISEGASNLVSGIKDFFVTGFQSLVAIVKGPVNSIIGIVNGAIRAINGIGFDIPDWVPVIGGKKFSIDIPEIQLLATGGFTDGPSIAGEAGTEAVISFDPAYRTANLAYWAQAGRMLGATASDTGFALSGSASGSTTIDMGGVTFAPNIQISGKADKESVVQAIEAEYPEFLDMLERWLYERGLPVYG